MNPIVERRPQQDRTLHAGSVLLAPKVDEDYWLYRVRMNDAGQAVLAFPKFGTIGVGFAQEEDWNTNLPYRCPAADIADHIFHNRADEEITRERLVEAIEAIQKAIASDQSAATESIDRSNR